MVSDAAAEIVTEWERRAGDRFKRHFQQARDYFRQTVSELASEDAEWTISDHEGHTVLLLAGDTAFALIAFSGEPDGITIKGALHPLDEGVIRVSFSDERAADAMQVEGMDQFTPIVRRWSFDWHGRLQLGIEYWLPLLVPVPADSFLSPTIRHYERQGATAHKLAKAAGWPMPAADPSVASEAP